MAQFHKRDEATYYNLVDANGKVVGTAAKSQIIKLKKQLQADRKEKLQIVLKREG